jgi:hypothetical protein
MLPPEILIKREGELLRSLRSARMAPELRVALVGWIPGAIDSSKRSLAPLQRANADSHARVRAAIHWAADVVLHERIRRLIPRCRWVGMVRHRLMVAPGSFGLERCPCRQIIGRELKEWSPPSGADKKRIENEMSPKFQRG